MFSPSPRPWLRASRAMNDIGADFIAKQCRKLSGKAACSLG